MTSTNTDADALLYHIRGITITRASRLQHQLSPHAEQYGGQPYQPHYVEVLTSTGEFGTVSVPLLPSCHPPGHMVTDLI